MIYMFYSDYDIYRKIRNGVTASILAQLNGCKTSDILDAYRRYDRFLAEKDSEYNNIRNMRNEMEKRRTNVLKENNTMGAKRFNYTPEIIEEIQAYILKGMNGKQVYNIMSKKYSGFSSYTTFCKKLKRMKENKTLVTPSFEDNIDANSQLNQNKQSDFSALASLDLTELVSRRKDCHEKLTELYTQVADLTSELIKLDIEIDIKENS